MPKVNVEIFYSVGKSERLTLKRTLEVSQDTSDQLVNLGGGNWSYVQQAEILICEMVKKEILQDVTLPIDTLEDLRRHGITSLTYSFIDENGEQMGSTVIHPD